MAISITDADFEKVLTDIGSYVPMRIGSAAFSWGEGSITWSSGQSGLAFVDVMSEVSEEVKNGIMNVGDIVAYADKDTGIFKARKMQLQWEGSWFQAKGDPMLFKVGNNEVFVQRRFTKT